MALRFVVGEAGSKQSSLWKLWSQGDEAYLASRAVAHSVKFSFHSSGICRWAEVNPRADGQDRCHHRWIRSAIPARGTGEATLLLSLLFPTNHLSAPKEITTKRLHWLPPAPAAMAACLEVILTQEDASSLSKLTGQGVRSVVFTKKLRSGLLLALLRHDVDCGKVELTVPGKPRKPGQVFLDDLAFPDIDQTGSGRPVRLTIFSARGENLPPVAYELGGYPVPASVVHAVVPHA